MKSVRDAVVKGKRVLVRVDFNVPLKDGVVVDESRIRASLPTIELLLSRGARVVLVSHLGRPQGVTPDLSLKPVASCLEKLLKMDVAFANLNSVPTAPVVLLENIRFFAEEELNDVSFAKRLASLGDLFVNDAFASCHRKHASVFGVAKLLPSFAGLLVEKEVSVLSSMLDSPKEPFVAILGGSKVSSKIGVIEKLLDRVDALIIGGAMMFTFLKAIGFEVGKSLVEDDKLDFAKRLLKKCEGRIMLPVDVVVARSESDVGRVVSVKSIPSDCVGFDVGPESVSIFSGVLSGANTVFWNGPLGMCEVPSFAKGTIKLIKILAEHKGTTIIGGGDSVAVVESLNLVKKFSHVSTGGGASLEFIENGSLPGIDVLK